MKLADSRESYRRTNLVVVSGEYGNLQKAEELSERLQIPCVKKIPEEGLFLIFKKEGLTLSDGTLSLYGDFRKMLARLKKSNLSGELLVRAAHLKNAPAFPTVLDATAGLGEDSLLLAASGFYVRLYEHNPVIAALLQDTMERAAGVPELSEPVSRMKLYQTDSLSVLKNFSKSSDHIPVSVGTDKKAEKTGGAFAGTRGDSATPGRISYAEIGGDSASPGRTSFAETSEGSVSEGRTSSVETSGDSTSPCRISYAETGGDSVSPDRISFMEVISPAAGQEYRTQEEMFTIPDIILLDPMFPTRQKSALVKKKLQLIQKLEPPGGNGEDLLEAAIKAGPRKVIVKRPVKGPYLGGKKPGYSLKGKAVRYDCFVM